MTHRVVITGLGVISALGLNRQEFWQSLSAGHSGIAPLEIGGPFLFAVPLNAAEVRNYDPVRYFEEKEIACWTASLNSAPSPRAKLSPTPVSEWTPELRARPRPSSPAPA